MRIAMLCNEYFHYRIEQGRPVPTQSHGGFGYLTRKKAEGFVERGHEVHVLVPAPHFDPVEGMGSEIRLGGVTVHPYRERPTGGSAGRTALPGAVWRGVAAATGGPIPSLERLIRHLDADIYVSENPSLASSSVPRADYPHLLIFHDPWGLSDVGVLRRAAHEYAKASGVRSLPLSAVSGSALPLYDELTNLMGTFLLRRLTHSLPSSHMFAEADCISERALRLYHLSSRPGVLPNPVEVPETVGRKSDSPTLCWIGRWDPQKRVDRMLRVASNCPEIEFYILGAPTRRRDLLEAADVMEHRFRRFENIHLMRFVSEEEKASILDRSWTLVNTSTREGLPTSFLEAWAHGASVVAPVDPDGLVTRFGQVVTDDNYESAIRESVRSEEYRSKGTAGRILVRDTYRTDHVVRRHLNTFAQVLEGPSPS